MLSANEEAPKPFFPSKYHVTFDVDWAPDFSIKEVLTILQMANIKATFFVTHPSDVIQDILQEGHEVGLHPNFLPNSSQGDSIEEVMDYLFEIHPDAKSIRTHSLYQSSPLLHKIFSKYPQLRIDLSTFMYKFPLVAPSPWHLDGVSFTRINYNWEDDVAFHDESFKWDRMNFTSDVVIFNFHPIHVSLNSRDNDSYGSLKQSLSGKPLSSTSKEEVNKFRSDEVGTRDFLTSIITSGAQSMNLNDLSREDLYDN